MPRPRERVVYEGSEECEAIRLIHSNPLQESPTYRFSKRQPDSGRPIRVTVEKLGNTAQPGDPIIVKSRQYGFKNLELFAGNPDNDWEAPPGYAVLVVDPSDAIDDRPAVWPSEIKFEFLRTEFVNARVLYFRQQASDYSPGLTDEEIKETRHFKAYMDAWFYQRKIDFRDSIGWPDNWEELYLPPEEYEIQNKINQLLPQVRAFLETQWNEWEEIGRVNFTEYEGSYWTGARDGNGLAVYADYYLNYWPQLDFMGFFDEDGGLVTETGISPWALRVYEFVDETGDYSNPDDWDNIFYVPFMGTPLPITVECDDSNCPNHCLEIIRPSDKAWRCLCSSDDDEPVPTPIAENPNRLSRRPPPNRPPRPPTIGDRKAKARNYIDKLKPMFDKAKADFKGSGDRAEAANNRAKDPMLSEADRDEAARDRDEALHDARSAGEAMKETQDALDKLRGFVGGNQAEEDSGVSVGGPPPEKPGGWRPPIVNGGNGWNNTPTQTTSSPGAAVGSAPPPTGSTWRPPIVNGGSGWNNTPTEIINTPGGSVHLNPPPPLSSVVGGGEFTSPTISGDGGFQESGWNSTPTQISETPEAMVSEVIDSIGDD